MIPLTSVAQSKLRANTLIEVLERIESSRQMQLMLMVGGVVIIVITTHSDEQDNAASILSST
jgi:hypothetical protein